MKFAILFVLAALFVLYGCKSGQHTAPAADVRAGETSLVQVGNAAVPATAQSERMSTVVPILAGATITVETSVPVAAGCVENDAPRSTSRVSITLPAAAAMTVETVKESVSGPVAFEPVATPSPKDEAAGKAALWLWLGLVGGVALAGLGIGWGGKWVTVGGLCVACACAFGLFVQSNPWVLVIAGVGITIAAAGFIVWHVWLKPRAA